MIAKKQDSVLVVRPEGTRLGAESALTFKNSLKAHIDSGERLLVLDLSGIRFMDSSGLGAVVSTLKAVGSRGDLVIAGLQPDVRDLFTLTRMDKIFRTFANVPDAVNSFPK